jgi:hypothetical membrane protein
VTQKKLGMLGIGAALLFAVALATLGALRPGYSHFTRPVSELGALNTQAMAVWNIFGFGVPGILLTIFGWNLGRNGNTRASALDLIAGGLLATLGMSLLLSGLFPADLTSPRGSITQRHIVASLIGMLWAPGTFIWAMRQRQRWPAGAAITGLSGLLFISSMALNDIIARGLEQRLRFGIALGWALIIGLLLVRGRGQISALALPTDNH